MQDLQRSQASNRQSTIIEESGRFKTFHMLFKNKNWEQVHDLLSLPLVQRRYSNQPHVFPKIMVFDRCISICHWKFCNFEIMYIYRSLYIDIVSKLQNFPMTTVSVVIVHRQKTNGLRSEYHIQNSTKKIFIPMYNTNNRDRSQCICYEIHITNYRC